MLVERGRHVAHGEANDRCSVGAGEGHAEESSVCGHADGLRSTSPAVPGKQVRRRGQNKKRCLKKTIGCNSQSHH